jgi:putative membrane protein
MGSDTGSGLSSGAAWRLSLLGAYVIIWTALAVAPVQRSDWLLENVLVFVAVPALVLGARRLQLSSLAWGGLFVFGVLHAIGAHYTYSLVPVDRWLDAMGVALQGRNDYDRVVHFSYGLLVLPAVAEWIGRRTGIRGFWGWMLPVSFIALHSMIYELIEWLAATAFGGDLGQAYLGTQGDVWDAQKDMALALLGAALSQSTLMLWRRGALVPQGTVNVGRSA